MKLLAPASLIPLLGLLVACAPTTRPVGHPFTNGDPGPLSSLTTGPVTDAPPPAPSQIDQTVANLIAKTLQKSSHLAAASKNVTVLVDNGVVTLSGTIPTAKDRKAIVEQVSRLPGVDQVYDQLVANY